MAASEPGPFSLRLKRVFEPSLANTSRWYAGMVIQSESYSYHIHMTQFIGDIVEVSIHDLVDDGPSIVVWLGKEERCGVVSTLFGILAKEVQGKKPTRP